MFLAHDPNNSNYYWDIWCARLDPIKFVFPSRLLCVAYTCRPSPDILVSSSLNGEVKMQMLSTEDGPGSDIFMRNHSKSFLLSGKGVRNDI